MSRLLYIEASPRKKRSSSIEVAHTYLEAYRQNHPEVEIETLDLWHTELPRFDGDVIDSKYAIMHGQAHTEAQRKSWRAVEQTIAHFKRADRYLFSLPMWNFGIPYPLKHYFDVIVQPSYTFSFSPTEGYKGLVTGKPVTLIYSRGGAYSLGTGGEALDLQKPYMEAILKFMGFDNLQSVVIEPTLAAPEAKEKAVKQAKEEAIQLAKNL
jgi:FMN-dependent NADH-azoreductase